MCPLARQRAKLCPFSRGNYRLLKDHIFTTREPRYPHVITRYESLATYAGHACLPLSLVAPRLMYLCISTDWLLLDSRSRIHASGNHVENTRKSAVFASRGKEK